MVSLISFENESFSLMTTPTYARACAHTHTPHTHTHPTHRHTCTHTTHTQHTHMAYTHTLHTHFYTLPPPLPPPYIFTASSLYELRSFSGGVRSRSLGHKPAHAIHSTPPPFLDDSAGGLDQISEEDSLSPRHRHSSQGSLHMIRDPPTSPNILTVSNMSQRKRRVAQSRRQKGKKKEQEVEQDGVPAAVGVASDGEEHVSCMVLCSCTEHCCSCMPQHGCIPYLCFFLSPHNMNYVF